jgi:transmembrane sensor
LKSPIEQQDRIEEQAAEWLAALDTGRADRDAFERWRAADPAHALAFIRMDLIWRDLDQLGRGRGALEAGVAPDQLRRPSRRRALIAAGMTTIFAAGGGTFLATQAAATTVETAIGERRRFYLTPRACLDLNTASRLRWWSKNGRIEVELERGEVAFDLGATAPPCLLHIGGSQFRLGGGRFNVRLRAPDAVDLVTFKGEAHMLEPRRQTIAQQQQVRLSRHGEETRAVSDGELQALAAWQSGELLFEGEPLSAGIAEFNRYLPTPIVLASADIGELRLGGRFRANDPTEFLKALRVDFGIHTDIQPDRILLTH